MNLSIFIEPFRSETSNMSTLPPSGELPCFEMAPFSWYLFITGGLIPTGLELFGIVGSAYSFNLLRKTNNSRFGKYLLALCLWDIALLISTFMSHEIIVLMFGSMVWNGHISYLYVVFYPFCHICMTGTMWMVLSITYERYMALIKPFKQRIREIEPVKWILLSIVLGAVLANIMVFFELTIENCMDKTGQTRPQIMPTTMRYDYTYILVYRVVMGSIFEGPIPILIIVLLSMKTMYAMKSRTEYAVIGIGFHMSEALVKDARMATILFGVIIKFVICYTAPIFINILEFVNPLLLFKYKSIQFCIYISNLLVIFHSATNWLILCRWRKTSEESRIERNNRILCVKLSRTEIDKLREIWAKIDSAKLGLEMLTAVFEENARLAWHFRAVPDEENTGDKRSFDSVVGDIVESEFRFRIRDQGERIGRFLDEVVNRLTGEDHMCSDVVNFVRHVGHLHFYNQINISNAEWFLIKDFLISQMVGAGSDNDRELCSKFVTFLIYQMKCGFLRQASADLEHSL